MELSIQPILQNENTILYPLQEDDFEALYAVASDPKIWEQHPKKDRWKKDVFHIFFDGAIQSRGAFKIIEKSTGKIAGSTRFYDYNEKENSILIGYTFYATKYWGKGINHDVKVMMLDYIFQHVNQVYFHIGSDNVRSQMAISRLGVKKVAENKTAYFGESPTPNFVYSLNKEKWINRSL